MLGAVQVGIRDYQSGIDIPNLIDIGFKDFQRVFYWSIYCLLTLSDASEPIPAHF